MASTARATAQSAVSDAGSLIPRCPLGGDDCQPAYWRDTEVGSRRLKIYRCERCRHAFVVNRSQEEVETFHDGEYRQEYFRDAVEGVHNRAGIINERFHRMREGFMLGRWDLVGSHFKPHHRVLDVGCGAGTFARHIAPNVAEVHGLELSSWLVDYVNEKGFATAYQCSLEDYDSDRPYDIVVTWHSMGHTVDVVRFIDRAADLLTEDGLLFLEVPTINDWRNPPRGGFYNDAHVHYFSPRSLCTLVSRRFSIFKTWTGLKPPATMLAARKRA